MSSPGSNQGLVPFGAPAWPLDRLAEIRAGRAAGPPLAILAAGRMLRINSGALHLPPPPPTEAEIGVAERIAAHLKRLGGGWNKTADRFIDSYFAFLAAQIDHHRAELVECLAPYEGLFQPGDFLFSAPLPLPQAFLLAPAEPRPEDEARPADFIRADFAFWLGVRLVAVLLAPSTLTPMVARRLRDRLAAAGIEVAGCTLTDLDDPEFGWFAKALGPECSRFWESEALPSAPSSFRLPDF